MKKYTKYKLLFLILIAGLGFSSCSGSNKYAKKAFKFQESGFYKEAADYYLIALKKKNTNIVARLGLMTNGQKVIDNHLQEFYQAHTSKDHKRSVYSFRQADDYLNEIKNIGVDLKIPAYYEGYYKEDLEIYVAQLYTEGNNHLQNADYELSDAAFDEIKTLRPNYKDVNELAILSRVEPLYIKAEHAFNRGNYREAYTHYSDIVALDPNYKDVQEHREYALKEAALTIAVINADHAYPNETSSLNTYITRQLVEASNPFIHIVDRSNVERIIQEQKIGMSGIVDQQTAISAGNIMGVKVILLGKILNYRRIDGSPIQSRVTAYNRVITTVYDKVTKTNIKKTRFDRTSYIHHYQKMRLE